MPPYFFLTVSARYVIKFVPRVLRMRKTDEGLIILFISRDGIQVGTGRISILIIPAVLRIPIRKILASWIRIRQNMQIHGSGSKDKISTKNYKKNVLLSKPKSELLKKERF